jgi:predicted nuclease of predicted toxin-antitoxin system
VKFKLDENFGTCTQQLFEATGHDVVTVGSEHLPGCSDQRLYDACRLEARCLVTLDLDFADVRRFPPDNTTGIVVIRLPRNPTLPILEALVRDLLAAFEGKSLAGRLWVVEPGRIRVHQTEAELDFLG